MKFRKGDVPVGAPTCNFEQSVTERLQQMEGNMNLHDIRIEKLEHTMATLEEQIKNRNAETTQAKLKE